MSEVPEQSSAFDSRRLHWAGADRGNSSPASEGPQPLFCRTFRLAPVLFSYHGKRMANLWAAVLGAVCVGVCATLLMVAAFGPGEPSVPFNAIVLTINLFAVVANASIVRRRMK